MKKVTEKSAQKRPRGRPRLHKNRVLTNAEMCWRYRQRKKRYFRVQCTGQQEWYTPEPYIEAARQVLGSIDLDPATSEQAQATIQAAHFYTADDDGLRQEWHGGVWLNPPYLQPLMGQFVDKLISEIGAGRVLAAILLTHNYSDTSWFHQAEAHAQSICFTKGRIRFLRADGFQASPTQGQAFFYFGARPERFAEVFSAFGFIAQGRGMRH